MIVPFRRHQGSGYEAHEPFRQFRLGELARFVRGQHAEFAQGEAPAIAIRVPVLDDERSNPGRLHAQSKARNLFVPHEQVAGLWDRQAVDCALGELNVLLGFGGCRHGEPFG